MVDLLILEAYLNAWVQSNRNLSAGVVEREALFTIVDGIVIFDCVNLWANYQMKHLKGGLGRYADALLAKMKPDIVAFLKERNVNNFQLTFEFRHSDNRYRTRQIYY